MRYGDGVLSCFSHESCEGAVTIAFVVVLVVLVSHMYICARSRVPFVLTLRFGISLRNLYATLPENVTCFSKRALLSAAPPPELPFDHQYDPLTAAPDEDDLIIPCPEEPIWFPRFVMIIGPIKDPNVRAFIDCHA